MMGIREVAIMFKARQFIPYETNVAIAPLSKQNGTCIHCKIPLSSDSHGHLCDVCWAILESLATTYWVKLQHAWWHENDFRKARKVRLLNPSLEDEGDSNPTFEA